MPQDQIGEGLAEPIPDVVEAIVGYRVWRWDQQGLKSDRGTKWTPGEALKAECSPHGRPWGLQSFMEPEEPTHEHTCPSHPDDTVRHGEHGCGIYAYATIEDAWRNLGERSGVGESIIGEVELWGLVWPHEKGYRAEYAKPRAFYRPARNEPTTFEAAVKKIEHQMLYGTSASAVAVTEPTTPFWGDPVEKLAELFDIPVVEVMLDEGQRQALVEEGRRERYAMTAQIASQVMTWPQYITSQGGWYSVTTSDLEPIRRRRWFRKPAVWWTGTWTVYGAGGASYFAVTSDIWWLSPFLLGTAVLQGFFLRRSLRSN